MICPIDLKCPDEECPNQRYCNNLAAAWPLPYQIWEIDHWHFKGALVVSIPDLTNWDEVPNEEWAIQGAEEYDTWINYIRRELKEAGWENPVELPYYWNEEKALIITLPFILARGTSEYPPVGFAPAVKLDNWRANWQSIRSKLLHMAGVPSPKPELDQWGFYLPNGVPGLAWKWQEDED
ncbi:MAG TPA: hypothetical protein V6D33_11835 [Cyanophyceae cyanobacterium]